MGDCTPVHNNSCVSAQRHDGQVPVEFFEKVCASDITLLKNTIIPSTDKTVWAAGFVGVVVAASAGRQHGDGQGRAEV